MSLAIAGLGYLSDLQELTVCTYPDVLSQNAAEKPRAHPRQAEAITNICCLYLQRLPKLIPGTPQLYTRNRAKANRSALWRISFSAIQTHQVTDFSVQPIKAPVTPRKARSWRNGSARTTYNVHWRIRFQQTYRLNRAYLSSIRQYGQSPTGVTVL